MSLDVARALKEGLDRLVSRNGLVFVGVFLLVSIVGNVALDSATLALESVTADLAAETGQPPPTTLPEGTTPLGFDLPGSVISLLLLVWLLAWAATSVVAVRVMASEHTGTIPDELFSRRLTFATVNEVFVRIVVLTLITVGLVFLVVPGVVLAICFYFVRPLIAIEDRNAIDAMVESWRLSRGDRVTIFLLLAGAVVVYVAISLVPAIGAVALSILPLAGTAVSVAGIALSIAFAAVANVFWLAVSARAFVQLREPAESETRVEESGSDDEWDDPPGVE
ncbi:hypothetical protein [Halalkalicoccus subterraneus]|uniref:hypothetical protein n=1 Tax=Halalkalicoccus subterraneus TaxID=2675002 RepID=UPI000EFC53F1|nr:hypothetical protein [Halalkalicoccus subterraneus]